MEIEKVENKINMTHNQRIDEGYDTVIKLLKEIKEMVDDLCSYLLFEKNVKKPYKNQKKKN